MHLDAKIYVAGHQGMVGSAILRKLQNAGYYNFVLHTSAELDLREQSAVQQFFEIEEPQYVFLAAAKVGGIHANNTYRAEFIYDNLVIQNNVIHQSFKTGVRKLVFLGSSCIYPKYAQQPIKEEALLTGPLEPTNEPYAIAKIAGIKMCQAYNAQYGSNFISLMPTNLYGPNDNYDLENAHVLPALMRKIHEAKVKGEEEVEIWGTGKVRREFLHVDDLADACLFLMNSYDKPDIINVGTGKDLSIYELAMLLKSVIGYKGRLRFNSSKPDGTPRKLLNTSLINQMGWYPKIELREGIQKVYGEYEKKHLQIY
ncbi:GDP-L-fucose synthase [Fulvivirga sp. 29W222]|uniref:GDP-L-fucose synthase n=1 Tax=Fulvivirga marina TaxID=2494733 RepID=A0A937KD08_9BACT|nr:GDP-L-fucose synthase [Fulvivirga marina]MBL6448097.1 GDP-L-fucose synthase [Fulvivirga marina]